MVEHRFIRYLYTGDGGTSSVFYLLTIKVLPCWLNFTPTL